jgi:hypothetical protein
MLESQASAGDVERVENVGVGAESVGRQDLKRCKQADELPGGGR